jgi:hypothetical protein
MEKEKHDHLKFKMYVIIVKIDNKNKNGFFFSYRVYLWNLVTNEKKGSLVLVTTSLDSHFLPPPP